jgi:CheY-like chemotaxis protein
VKTEDKVEFESGLDRPLPVLMVEDESDYSLLVQECIQDPSAPCALHVVESGEAAIAYLSGQGAFADRSEFPFPFLILLDLKMPGTGGFGVLRWLMAHSEVKDRLKVIILSGVQSTKEIEVVYELGAQLFCPKSDTGSLQQELRRLRDSWLRLN